MGFRVERLQDFGFRVYGCMVCRAWALEFIGFSVWGFVALWLWGKVLNLKTWHTNFQR